MRLSKRISYPLYGLGAVAGMVLGGVLWIGSDSGEEWVRVRIERSVSGAMSEGRAVVGSFSINGLSHVELHGFELFDAMSNAVVTVDELIVDFNPLAMVLGTLDVNSIDVSGLGLEVDVDEDGASSLSKMFVSGGDEQDSEALGFEVLISEFGISDVSVNYREAPVGLADPVEYLVELDLQGGFQLISGVYEIPHLTGQTSINGTAIEFKSELYSSPVETRSTIELAGLGSRLVASGSYSPVVAGEERWGLTLSEVELDLQALGELVDVPLVGRVVASVTGEQDGGVASINGNLRHGAGGLDVTGELVDSHSSISLAPSELNLTAITPLVSEPVVLSGLLRLNSDTLAGMISPEINIVLEDSIIWGVELTSASLVGRYDGDGLVIDEFSMESPIVSASASGVVTESGADLDIALSDADMRQFHQFGAPLLRGAAAADGHVHINWSGEEVEIEWDGGVYVSQFSNPDASFRSLSGPVSASIRGEQFTASGESVISGVTAAGVTLDLVEFQWSVDSADSLEWSSTVSVESLSSGDLTVSSVTGRVAGSGDSVHGRLDLTLINGFTQVWPSGILRFDLRDRFRFTGSILGAENNEIALDIVSDRGFSEFELRELSVALEEQDGWATTGPTIIRRGGDSLAVRGLELVSEGGGAVRLDATGSMNGPISANLHLAQFPLDWIEPWVDETGFEGLISGDITLGGRSEALRVEADLNSVGLSIPNAVSDLDCEFSISTDDEAVAWEAEIKSADNSLANFRGNLPVKLSLSGVDVDWNGPLAIDGSLAPVSNSHWREGVPSLSGLPDGRSSVSISLAGTLREPMGVINAGVAWRLGTDNRQFRIDLGLELEQAQVTMVGAGRTGGVHLFDLRGSIGTALGEALQSLAGDDVAFPSADEWIDSFEVGLAPMGISMDLLRGFAPVPEALDGLISGSLSVVGGGSEPRAVMGISLSEGTFGQAQIPSAVLSLVPSEGHYDLSLFGAVGAVGIEDVYGLVVTGSIPFGGMESAGLELKVEGPELPLELLTGIIPDLTQVRGRIAIDGEVRGSIAAPVPRVAMSIDSGEFQMPTLGVGLSELQVDAVLNEDGVNITRFSGATDQIGDISGDIFDSNGSFEGALDYSYEDGLAGGFTCDGLSLIATPKQTLRTTGHLSLEGAVESVNVVGEFVVDEGRYVLTSSDWLTDSEVALSSAIILHRDGAELAVVAPEEPAIFEGWNISLDVDLAQNTWIDVSMPLDDTFGSVTSAVSTVGLDGRLDGELQVDYTPEIMSSNSETGEVLRSGGLDVVGELLVIRGNTKVFGKDFAVDDGSVRFTGGGLEEPELDISATQSNREYGDIVVDIAGQPRKMALAFSSSEGWSDTDMASILLLGRPVSNLTQSEGGAGLNLVGTALGVMAGTASSLVQMSSMVDTIEVESEGESISLLSVGWALGSDLFVTYSKDYTALAGDNISEITLEWLISKRIQAELSTGDRGQSSADLYMKWRF